jgi:hypothetical protein
MYVDDFVTDSRISTKLFFRLPQLCSHKLMLTQARLIPHTAKGGRGKLTGVPPARYKMAPHHQHLTSLVLHLLTSRAAVDGPTHKIARHHEARLVYSRWLQLAVG